jgi:cardiolipin synthase
MRKKENIRTIPNLLSLYRLLSFPLVFFLILHDMRQWFILMLTFNLFTDFLDGYIARKFNQQTEFGARLDSWADAGTYILAFAGMFQFEWTFVSEHWLGLSLFAILYLASLLFTLLKFGRLCGLHLYSFKLGGYLQGGFLMVLFWYGNLEWFYLLMIIVGCLACIEQLIIIYLLTSPRSNVKGLYWIYKQ